MKYNISKKSTQNHNAFLYIHNTLDRVNVSGRDASLSSRITPPRQINPDLHPLSNERINDIWTDVFLAACADWLL